jgi:trimeric autotransporter adhesin
MMKLVKTLGILLGAAALLGGCGGASVEEPIGGSVIGLLPNTTLTLFDNGGDTLTVTSNGTFTFATQVEAGDTYDVTVDTMPAGQNCTVVNGIGVVEQAVGSVTSVTVECVPTASANNFVQGTIGGLADGATLTLENNGTNSLSITGNGQSSQVFSFPTPLPLGSSYSVAVSQQPTVSSQANGQTCTLSSASGTILAASVPNVSITCK